MGIQFKLINTVWDELGLIDSLQYGFRPGLGTEQARCVSTLTMEHCFIYKKDTERGTEDKRHAFDSPDQVGGYELALLRLGIPESLIDIISLLDLGGHLMIKTAWGNTAAIPRLRGTIQGGEESPNKWTAYDDIFITRWNKEQHTGISVEISDCKSVKILGTAYADDKHYITKTGHLEELYSLASKNSAFHMVEVVPKKCECQRTCWDSEGNILIEECEKDVKIQMNMGTAEKCIKVIPPDEPLVSLGDKSNMLLSWGWTMSDVGSIAVEFTHLLRVKHPKHAVQMVIDRGFVPKVGYNLLMSSVSRQEIEDVVRPLFVVY